MCIRDRVLARLGVHLLVVSLDPRILPPYSEITLDASVLAFTFLTCLLYSSDAADEN